MRRSAGAATTTGSRVEYITAQDNFAGVQFADHDGDPPVYVVSVAPDSGAYSKGVHDGDVVVTLDGEDVRRKRHSEVAAVLHDVRTQKILGLERQIAVSAADANSETEGAR